MYPHPTLRAQAKPVTQIDEMVRALWDEMLEAMYMMPGVGLAAPQLGSSVRLAVLDCSDGRDQPVRLANPEILHESIEMRTRQEGSPNLPDLWADVSRPRAVTVRFLNSDGDSEERDFVGLWATSVQHQIDHLNGRIFTDHLSPVKRRLLIGKHMKAMKRERRR